MSDDIDDMDDDSDDGSDDDDINYVSVFMSDMPRMGRESNKGVSLPGQCRYLQGSPA